MAASNVSAFSLDHRIPTSNAANTNRHATSYHGNNSTFRKINSIQLSSLVPGRIDNQLFSPMKYNSVRESAFGNGPGFLHLRALTGQKLHAWLPCPCRVKSGDSKETSSGDSEETSCGESIMLDVQSLELELQAAIKEEDYTQAAKIRDNICLLQEDDKASVLAANARFYDSFRNGDLVAMQALWARGGHVRCVHPEVSGIAGYDLVMGSWESVWADYGVPLHIELKDVQVHVRGDLGYVICLEFVKPKGGNWGKLFATNVFERVDGRWFLTVHHASQVDL